tara:strand:- start:337 stop:1392 length:1056 start_codon:yes stop_codon:yes gene_type:complete
MPREPLLPGEGKKQLAVLMNTHARRLEHRRHLEELGFPQEQDKSGKPELEARSVRHAPVSYDDPSNPTPSKIVNQAGQDLGDPNSELSLHDKTYKIKKAMKRIVYPDVRIEVRSGGLIDKLLGRDRNKPAVVGEEKPEGKNLPDINTQASSLEALSRFTRGNKKPTYVGISKEEEGDMARAQLNRVSDLADMTHNIVEAEDELPGWIQNKISDSLHNMEATFASLSYKEKKELGLVKMIHKFKDFLVKAPKKGADSRLKNAGVSGYNKPKRTPKHPTKSHIVVAKVGSKIKTIRFGQQGKKVSTLKGTAGAPKKGESTRMKAKRKSFKARHAKNIKRGPMSAAYWADKVKW